MKCEYYQVHFSKGEVEVYAFNVRQAAILAMAARIRDGKSYTIYHIERGDEKIFDFDLSCPFCGREYES